MCAAVIDHFTRRGICTTVETGPEQGPIDDTYTRVRELMLKHVNADTVNCKDTEEGAQEKENEDGEHSAEELGKFESTVSRLSLPVVKEFKEQSDVARFR